MPIKPIVSGLFCGQWVMLVLIHSLLLEFAVSAFRSIKIYSILELKQGPKCQVLLKSIQHISLGNDVTSSDKNIVVVWLKHISFFLHTIYNAYQEHTFEIGDGQKQDLVNISSYLSVST